MQICPDPLEAVRSVGLDHQWCVTLPACYPTIIPYIPSNIEYNGQKAFNARTSNFDVNNYDCTNILDSSLCANSQLIQRIRRKIDLYQTPLLNDAHERFQRSTDIVKQHVADGDVREGISRSHQSKSNIQHDILPMSISGTSKSRSPSLLHQAINRKIADERVSTEGSSHHSDSSDSSLHSTNSSTYSNQTNDSSSQFSSTQSVQSSSEDSESNVDEMGSSVPSISSTPHFSKQHIAGDRVDLRQTAHNMKNSSNHPGNSAIQSPISYISYSEQQELLTPSSTSAYSHRSPSIKTQYRTQVEHTFIDEKISCKHLNIIPFHDSSPENPSSMHINDRKRFNRLHHLHMREAMTALELDLNKEVFQALINKKKDSEQNRLMYILTAPSRCCRSCRTQRRLATVAQRSIDFAVKKYTNTFN